MADLLEQIELPQCVCLNACGGESAVRKCLEAGPREDPAEFLQSDGDEELLIRIKFMQAVKISSIRIEGAKPDSAPSSLKLFVNPLDSFDFDSARDEKATQEVTLSAQAVAPSDSKAVDLRFVLFQNVTSLGIFIPVRRTSCLRVASCPACCVELSRASHRCETPLFGSLPLGRATRAMKSKLLSQS